MEISTLGIDVVSKPAILGPIGSDSAQQPFLTPCQNPVNPSEPHLPESSETIRVPNAKFPRTVTAKFNVTSELYLESLKRYQSEQPKGWRSDGTAVWIFFIACGLLGFLFRFMSASAIAVAISVLVLVFFVLPIIWKHLSVSRIRNMPDLDYEVTVHLSDEGFFIESVHEKAEIPWRAFSKAVIFDDGVLLCKKPNAIHWFSDASLDGEDDPKRLRELVTAKMSPDQVVYRATAV